MRANTIPGKRVLMLLQNAPYPHDERVRREARTLTAAGYRVAIISPATRGQCWRETLNGVRVYRFPGPPAADGFLGYLWEYVYSMAAIFVLAVLVLLREGFDIVHAHHHRTHSPSWPDSSSCSASVTCSTTTTLPRSCTSRDSGARAIKPFTGYWSGWKG